MLPFSTTLSRAEFEAEQLRAQVKFCRREAARCSGPVKVAWISLAQVLEIGQSRLASRIMTAPSSVGE
jgi:hypothetical protein